MDERPVTDEALLAEAAREGSDGLAFATLVERHREKVWRLCYRFMDNEHDAQDALQEVFVRLFMVRERFEGRAKFSTWLHGIAVRTCLHLRRGRGRKRQREQGSFDVALGESAASPPAAQSDALDLRQMLSTLDDEDRALLILKYTEEYTFEELAEMFGISLSAAKMRVSRARERLQKRFGEPPRPSNSPPEEQTQ